MKKKKELVLFLLSFLALSTFCKGVSSQINTKTPHKPPGVGDKSLAQEYHRSTIGVRQTTNSNIPVKLTILPTDTITPTPAKVSTESKEGTVRDDEKKSNHRATEDNQDHLPNGGRKVTGRGPLSQKGTGTDNPPVTMAAHHEIMSSEIRWDNVAHLRNVAEDDRQKRFKRKRKRRSDLTEEDEDTEDPGASVSSIIIGVVCAGIVVFLGIVAGLICLWKKCKKRCLRRKPADPELGLESANEQSEEPAKANLNTPSPPSSQMETTYGDAQVTWTLTDNPMSTPLMTIITDTPRTEAFTIIEIPESTSLDISFSCSSLPDAVPRLTSGTPQSPMQPMSPCPQISKPERCSQSSLTSVSEYSVKSAEESCTQSLSQSPNDSLRSASVNSLTSKLEASSPDLSVTSTVPCTVTDIATASSSESSPSSHPATPKKSSSFKLSPRDSDEFTNVVSMTTDSSSSFTQSSKTPVAIRNEVVITIEDDDDGEVIYKSEKTRTEHGVIGFATVGNADKNGAAWVMNDSCNGEPPTPPGPVQPPTAATELRRRKGLIGGRKALENRNFIKHLTTEQFSTGLESDLNTAISRVLKEKKHDVDRSREKRRVIKHRTQETKYSFTESILRSKSMIMDEKVDKLLDRQSARRRQAIQQTHRYQGSHYGVQPKRKLSQEIDFAKAIILPSSRHPRAAKISKNKRKVASQLTVGSRRLMKTVRSTSYTRPGANTRDESFKNRGFADALYKFPQKGCLCLKCNEEREKALAQICPPPSKKQSTLLKYKTLLAAKLAKSGQDACSPNYVAVPIPEVQHPSTTSDVCSSSNSSNSDSEDEKLTVC